MEVPPLVYTVIPWLQLLFTIMLIFVSGIAWCFNLWILPIIRLNTSTSALTQFAEVSKRGAKYLDPLNAGIAITLALIAILQTQHPFPVEGTGWKVPAAASFTLFQVAWWERVMIFCFDDAAVALKEDRANSKGGEGLWLREAANVEFARIMDCWERSHAVRATLPLIAAVILLAPRVL
ncbi:hypothetical protein LTR56_005102 [Elasticomyces elasticus]|nr:hypothetical protein LTR22_021993 [Elasticomyces elasticus]KAK3652392.1 hypothetical protein LTR56_005102 [Elasticomyces elasticus]KAK4921260.1 hypothetical protein LTR49_011263 [Elasticomyces elasticus]